MITNPRGFTLIEAIVYLALFSLLMGGAVVSAYDVFESSGRGSTHATLQEEGSFLLAKVSWALSGAQAITAPFVATPPCSTPASTLTVSKWDATIGTVAILQSGHSVSISRGGGAPLIINSPDVLVSNLSFTQCWGGGSNPDSVATSFTLSSRDLNGESVSQDFSSTDYVRR